MKTKDIKFSIAIDGSSASGKTTGSKIISKKFKFALLSSGLIYRYLAYKIINNNNNYDRKFVFKESKKITLKKLRNRNLFSLKVNNILDASTRKNKWIPIYKNFPTFPKMERDINFVFFKSIYVIY